MPHSSRLVKGVSVAADLPAAGPAETAASKEPPCLIDSRRAPTRQHRHPVLQSGPVHPRNDRKRSPAGLPTRIQYLIIDGGSSDDTADVVREYSNRLTWISEKDRGQSHAINKGFSMARGEILAWLNSDDTILPGAVWEAVRAFERRPEAGAVYGEGYQIDIEGQIKSRFPHTAPFNLWKLILTFPTILCSKPSSFGGRCSMRSATWTKPSTGVWIWTYSSGSGKGIRWSTSPDLWGAYENTRKPRQQLAVPSVFGNWCGSCAATDACGIRRVTLTMGWIPYVSVWCDHIAQS